MTTIGVAMIDDERTRQFAEEGYTDLHDDEHSRGEFVAAASAYLMSCVDMPDELPDDVPEEARPMMEMMMAAAPMMAQMSWPFDKDSFKPSDDILRNLVRAGAFIAAEIDRRVRAEGWRG